MDEEIAKSSAERAAAGAIAGMDELAAELARGMPALRALLELLYAEPDRQQLALLLARGDDILYRIDPVVLVSLCGDGVGSLRLPVQHNGKTLSPQDGATESVNGVSFAAAMADTGRNRAEFLATHDSMTGLPNRVLLVERMREATARHARDGSSFALLFVDLDDFKRVNDNVGHAEGDRLLREIAARLSQAVREIDLVVRYGGDEFVVLLDGAGIEQARQTAQRVSEELLRPCVLGGRLYHPGASIGVSLYPEDGADPEALLMSADRAMYQVKLSGKRAWQFHTRELRAQTEARIALEAGLYKSIIAGELQLRWQPQFDALSGDMVGVEAIPYWEHPHDGWAPYHSWRTLAESIGMTEDIDAWSLAEACGQVNRWDGEQVVIPRVSLNLSLIGFERGEMAQTLAQVLQQQGVSGRRMMIEVDEAALACNPSRLEAGLRAIEATGAGLSIDGFGNQGVSLVKLRRLPVHEVKISSELVVQATMQDDAVDVARAIVSLATTFGYGVVASGVSSEAQQHLMQAIGCHVLQGDWQAAAMSASQLAEQLRHQ